MPNDRTQEIPYEDRPGVVVDHLETLDAMLVRIGDTNNSTDYLETVTEDGIRRERLTGRGRRLAAQVSELAIGAERHLWSVSQGHWPRFEPGQDPVYNLYYAAERTLAVVGPALDNLDGHPDPEAVAWGAYTLVHDMLARARELDEKMRSERFAEVTHA